MFNLFRKPKAVIVVTRTTGQLEQCQVTVNAYDSDAKSIYNAVTEAGKALQQRMVDYNAKALEALDHKEEAK